MYLKALAKRLITTFFLSRLPGVHGPLFILCRIVWRERAKYLRVICCCVDIDAIGYILLSLNQNRNIPIIRERLKTNTSPISRPRKTGRPVPVGITNNPAKGIKADTDRIIIQGGKHNWIPRLPDKLYGPANSVVDIKRCSRGGKASLGPQKFYNETSIRITEKPQTCLRVKIVNMDVIPDHMHNIRIIPHTLNGDFFTSDNHATDAC